MGNLQTQIHDKPLLEIGINWFAYEIKSLSGSINSIIYSHFQKSLDSLLQIQIVLFCSFMFHYVSLCSTGGKGKPRCVPYCTRDPQSLLVAQGSFTTKGPCQMGIEKKKTDQMPQRKKTKGFNQFNSSFYVGRISPNSISFGVYLDFRRHIKWSTIKWAGHWCNWCNLPKKTPSLRQPLQPEMLSKDPVTRCFARQRGTSWLLRNHRGITMGRIHTSFFASQCMMYLLNTI